ncbi:MAG: hypothetical protein IPK13_08455 [Deltaproteobacteria bacterium]|nr:hypothetical protein [Deltaproteobacteria bacterium]
MAYDVLGKLIDDTSSSGHGWTLAREPLASKKGHRVTVSQLSGESRTYTIENMPDGQRKRTLVDHDGTETITTFGPTTQTTTFPDGVVETKTLASDPRFGMSSPYVSRIQVRDPATRQERIASFSRSIEFEVPGDPGSSLATVRNVATVNGQVLTTTYSTEERTYTESDSTTPLTRTLEHDENGLPVAASLVDSSTGEKRGVSFSYTNTGRLQGIDGERTGEADRTIFAYDGVGQLSTIRNPLGHEVVFAARNAGGLPTRIVDSNGGELTIAYDLAGAITQTNDNGRMTHWARDPSARYLFRPPVFSSIKCRIDSGIPA